MVVDAAADVQRVTRRVQGAAMRFWASVSMETDAGKLGMHDVKFAITHDYTDELDSLIDNHAEPREL